MSPHPAGGTAIKTPGRRHFSLYQRGPCGGIHRLCWETKGETHPTRYPGHSRNGGPQRELAIAVDGLLEDLARENPEACSIVEMKFFLGLTDEETSEALNMPVRSLQRRWQAAREWLFRRLESRGWKKDWTETTST